MCASKELLTEVTELKEKFNKEYNNINKKQSIADKKIQDLLHKVELHSFSASEGYKLARMIKDARLEKRFISDERSKLNKIKRIFSFDESKYSKILSNQIQTLNNRTYTPRILKDLF